MNQQQVAFRRGCGLRTGRGWVDRALGQSPGRRPSAGTSKTPGHCSALWAAHLLSLAMPLWQRSSGGKRPRLCKDGLTGNCSEQRAGKRRDAGLVLTAPVQQGCLGGQAAGTGLEVGSCGHSPLTRPYFWARRAACRRFPLPMGPRSSTLGVNGAFERWLVWT